MSRRAAAWLIPLAVAGSAAAQPPAPDGFAARLVRAALAQTSARVIYDGSYRRLRYPNGDVPPDIGVCSDVVIRAYRPLGIDLQVEVHEDMKAAFSSYPQLWKMHGPDANIDHRRVPNLQTFFRRHGAERPVSTAAADYEPGDLVTWMLPGNLPHIGIVADARASDSGRPLIVHNIGRGPQVEDMLFRYRITGHYRYTGRSGPR